MIEPQVIEITLNGTPNQMAFLYMDTVYVVHNANSLADAQHAIADKEGIYTFERAKFFEVLYAQQRKHHKYKWLRARGYRRISSSSLSELDEIIARHHGLEF